MKSEQKILEQAANWFIVLQESPHCLEKKQDFSRWLALENNAEAWQKICQVEQMFSPINLHHNIVSKALLTSSSDSHRHMNRRGALKRVFGFAALGVCSWQLSPWANKQWQHAQADYKTLIGEINQHILEDNSQLSLNTNSAVNVNFTNNSKTLTLVQGEIAIITGNSLLTESLAKDPRQFFVKTSLAQRTITIEALGTEFTVKKTAKAIIVNVQGGRVSLSTENNYYLVEANQQLVFTDNQKGEVTTLNPVVNDWQQGKFSAYNLPLADLCAELSRYTYAFISVDDSIADIKVVGTFPLLNLEQSMQLLAASLPITLSRRTKWWWLLSAK